MLDPLLTNVLRRRISASLVDLGIVGVAAAAAAFVTSEKFTPEQVDPSTGDPIWSTSDHARLQELSLDSWNRATTVGDTQYIWTKSSLQLLALVVVMVAAITFFVLPALTQSSIGQRLFKLRVADVRGRPASFTQHLIRSVIGIVDLLPFVLPGLLGWLVAKRGTQKQRLGDLAAGTTVIDKDGAVRLMTEAEVGQRSDRSPEKREQDDSMVDLGTRLGASPIDTGHVELSDADLLNLDVPSPNVTSPATSVEDLGLASVPLSDLGIPDTRLPDLGLAFSGESMPSQDAEAALPGIDVPERILPEFMSPEPRDLADVVSESLPATTPLPVEAPLPVSTAATVPQASEAEPTPPEVESDLSPDLPPPPLHRATSWAQPVAEPAPVWVPDSVEVAQHVPAASPVEPIAVETAIIEPIAVEPIAVEPIALEPIAVEPITVEPIQQTTEAAHDAVGSVSTEPEWSEEWQAWIYWDASHAAWLRHNSETDSWSPLS